VRRVAVTLLATVVAVTVAGCGADESADDSSATSTSATSTSATTALTALTATTALTTDQRFPAVIAAVAVAGEGGWSFDVTISSPYDTPQRYADAWRIVGPDGTVFGVRELAHDHAAEQPFTRSLSGVTIPDDVVAVTIEGRDLANGWGGPTLEVALDRNASGS